MNDLKKFAIILIKITVSFGLVIWMIYSGKLDLTSIAMFKQYPYILILGLSCWIMSVVTLGTLRWYYLVNGIGVPISKKLAFKITMMGLFFNTFLPGSVGGDLVKGFYVYRNQKGNNRAPAIMSILLDRVLGLCSLFILITPVILSQWTSISQNKLLLTVAISSLSIGITVVTFIGLVLLPLKRVDRIFLNILSKKIFGFPILFKIYKAISIYRQNPRVIFKSIVVSMLGQTILMLTIASVTVHIFKGSINYPHLFTIIPLSLFVTAIPISPGGLGVGHVVFDKFFHIIGIAGGANIFNAVFLTVTLPNLLGIIPYLFMKNQSLYSKQVIENSPSSHSAS